MDLKLSEENNSKLEKKGVVVERFLNIEKCRATRTKMIYHIKLIRLLTLLTR